jgi:hypothetical protein
MRNFGTYVRFYPSYPWYEKNIQEQDNDEQSKNKGCNGCSADWRVKAYNGQRSVPFHQKKRETTDSYSPSPSFPSHPIHHPPKHFICPEIVGDRTTRDHEFKLSKCVPGK